MITTALNILTALSKIENQAVRCQGRFLTMERNYWKGRAEALGKMEEERNEHITQVEKS